MMTEAEKDIVRLIEAARTVTARALDGLAEDLAMTVMQGLTNHDGYVEIRIAMKVRESLGIKLVLIDGRGEVVLADTAKATNV